MPGIESASLPLEGIRILDFSQLIAGPSATSMLVELGADVIKFETPEGDSSRRMGRGRKEGGVSAAFAAYNGGKRSISLDLAKPEAREAARKLIASCDVVLQAFRPGVMDRLGLGYEAASALRPGLIYISFSGFGSDGPDAGRPGVDLIIQGESGIMAITGEADREPMKIGFTAVDATAGFAIANAILAGLIGRMRTGEGRHVNLSLLDVALFMQAVPMAEYLMTGEEPVRTGNAAPLGSPAELFNTRDGNLILSAYFNNQWPDFCRVLKLDHIVDDPRFIDNTQRIANRPELHAILQDAIGTYSSAEIKALLATTRVTFGDVLTYPNVVTHPQVQHNGAIRSLSSEGGNVDIISPPLRRDQQLSLPGIGESSRTILAEIGYSDDQIAEIMA